MLPCAASFPCFSQKARMSTLLRLLGDHILKLKRSMYSHAAIKPFVPTKLVENPHDSLWLQGVCINLNLCKISSSFLQALPLISRIKSAIIHFIPNHMVWTSVFKRWSVATSLCHKPIWARGRTHSAARKRRMWSCFQAMAVMAMSQFPKG